MASQLGRPYGSTPPQQNLNGAPVLNTQNKTAEAVPSDNGRGELLVKQTYWDYDDFMNTNIRKPPKKCYYEMMSRDEFNIRQDLCKDLEVKRNNIIEKIGRDMYGKPQPQTTEDNLPQYSSTETPNNRYNTRIGEQEQYQSPQQILELDNQNLPPQQQNLPPQQQYQPPHPLPPPRNQARQGGERENMLPPRPIQNPPRPRSLPYHMRSPVTLQPRPGPGIVTQISPPPPNEACNIYYSYMNLNKMQQDNRMKQQQHQGQGPPPPPPPPQLAPVQHPHEAYNTCAGPQQPSTSHSDKYYQTPMPNSRSKLPRRYLTPPQAGIRGQMPPNNQYVFSQPPPNVQRYQYPPTTQEPAMQEARQGQMLPSYEANNQPCVLKYPSKPSSRSLQCPCPSTCSCPLRDNNTKQPKKINNRQNVMPRHDNERQFRATSLESMPPPLQPPQVQYTSKPEQQCPPQYNSDHEYGPRQQLMHRPAPQPQYEESNGNARPPYAGAPNTKPSPLQPNILGNLKPRRPSQIDASPQTYQYSPQPNNNVQTPPQQLPIQQIHTNNALPQTGGQQQQQKQQQQQQQQQLQPQRQYSPPVQKPRTPVPPSEPIRNDVNQSPPQIEVFDEYNMDYQHQSNSGKQLFVTMPPPKARTPNPYNWTSSQTAAHCETGETWNDMFHEEYGYSDTDNCELEDGEEEEEDDNSW